VEHQVPSTKVGNGFCFDRYEPLDLYTCMVRAWESFQYKENWQEMQIRGMAGDFSWDSSAKRYIELYRSIPGMEKA
jgi:starch synthase